MVHRLEIAMTVVDTRAEVLARRFVSDGYPVKIVAVSDVYSIDKAYAKKHTEQIVSLLANPLTQKAGFTKPLGPKKFTWALEIGFLPGVTDNVAATAREMIEDLLGSPFKKDDGVYTSRVIYIDGRLSKEKAQRLASGLYNPLIQRMKIKDRQQFKKDRGMGGEVPRVKLTSTVNVTDVNLHVDDNTLAEIGKSGISNIDGTRRGPLALDLYYLKAIQSYFKKLGRNPTDVELESLAQTWSEHCKHTIFSSPIDGARKGLFSTYIKAATEKVRKLKGKKDICISVFTDNSGAIEFDDTHLITHKVETHNSPSALDPFGGAVTGIVGVNRDCLGFGLGAKPVMNMYGFCLANPNDHDVVYRTRDRSQPLLSPRRIFDGVVAGVNAGGNCSGIPTPQGFLFFDSRYKGKPLVFVGTVGLMPKTIHGKKSYVKKARPGDLIVMVGGRVGLDGIHGATFSSQGLHEGSPAGAVQIGDPITQKKMSDALIKEARDMGFYTSITDNGAGGLSCSVAEMAKESGGCLVDISKVPLKYPGLAPWQIWISESQERMTLAVPREKWSRLRSLLAKRGVEATVIGKFTASGKCVVLHGKTTVMNMDMKFLHDGMPARSLLATDIKRASSEPVRSKRQDFSQLFLAMLSRPNIGSFAFISQQYDHEVQGTSVIKPLVGGGRVNSDAQVIRPVLSSSRGVVVSQGLYPTYGDIDTYHMAASAIDTAIKNAITVGADPDHIALLDNFCWSSSNDPKRLSQLVQAARACYDYAVAYQTPFISGKDSMFNDFHGFDDKGKANTISVPPTLLISSVGVMHDCTKAVSSDAKVPGDLIYLLGETHDELGGSEYFGLLSDTHNIWAMGNTVPHVDAKRNWKLYLSLASSIQSGLIASAQSVHRGGLAVALAKTALGGQLGIEVELPKAARRTLPEDSVLFSESQGRIVVTVAPENKASFEKCMKGNLYSHIGCVKLEPRIHIGDNAGKSLVDCSLSEADRAYKRPFMGY